jgi:hypothetical protein
MPSYDHFQYFRSYLEDREDILNAIVFQSNGIPSTAYKFSDFMKSLEIAVLQLPVDKAFYLGDATISGMEYGYVFDLNCYHLHSSWTQSFANPNLLFVVVASSCNKKGSLIWRHF